MAMPPTIINYELLLQQERQRNKELEQRVAELTAALEKLRDEHSQMQIKVQLEAALRKKDRLRCQRNDRQQRSVSASPTRAVRIRSMQLKLTRSKNAKFPIRSPCNFVRSLPTLPEEMREHVQQQVQRKQQLFASVIENQKTAVATEQTTRAFQERLHITESKNVNINDQNPVASPSLFPLQHQSSPIEDQQKRKLMQHRLKWYLHTQTCRPPDLSFDKDWHCGQFNCDTTKKILVHMSNCNGAMDDCAMPLCSSTREVIDHWQSCADDDCSICRPAKQNLQVQSQVLTKTLKALNEGMDVSVDDEMTKCVDKCNTLGAVGVGKRVAFVRPRWTVESEAESDVGA